jgi:biotin synthase
MMENQKEWTLQELQALHSTPLFSLMAQSHEVHRQHHPLGEVQVCTVISIKTGGCPEDCKWCAQSSYYKTATAAEPMLELETVLARAKKALEYGASRVCLAAAWRGVRDSKQFDQVLEMIKRLNALGIEVCCTLGMLKESQAEKLKQAGLYAYNHNLESSERFYSKVVTTHTYKDRVNTNKIARQAGLTTCCGGIFGMGESVQDRLELLLALSKLGPPESVPINVLERIPGTPLEQQNPIDTWEVIRMVAMARILFPRTMVRLSAGREKISLEQQLLCFFAGANSIHSGDKLLTVPNISFKNDMEMFQLFGLTKRPPFKNAYSRT